jgi:hypothetical protein
MATVEQVEVELFWNTIKYEEACIKKCRPASALASGVLVTL